MYENIRTLIIRKISLNLWLGIAARHIIYIPAIHELFMKMYLQ